MTNSPDATYVSNTKDYLRQLTLETFLEEYKEVHQTWRNLENKAQANITLSGIFLAAAVAYIEKMTPASNPMENFLLVSALVLLGLSVVLSVLVLALRDVTYPPMGDFLSLYVPALLRKETAAELRAGVEIAFARSVEEWKASTNLAKQRNADKAQRLSEAQGLLVGAIALFALLTIMRVVGSTT